MCTLIVAQETPDLWRESAFSSIFFMLSWWEWDVEIGLLKTAGKHRVKLSF